MIDSGGIEFCTLSENYVFVPFVLHWWLPSRELFKNSRW